MIGVHSLGLWIFLSPWLAQPSWVDRISWLCPWTLETLPFNLHCSSPIYAQPDIGPGFSLILLGSLQSSATQFETSLLSLTPGIFFFFFSVWLVALHLLWLSLSSNSWPPSVLSLSSISGLPLCPTPTLPGRARSSLTVPSSWPMPISNTDVTYIIIIYLYVLHFPATHYALGVSWCEVQGWDFLYVSWVN